MKKLFYTFLLASAVSACDLNEVNINPDTPTIATPSALATGVILEATESQEKKWFLEDSWVMKQTSYSELMELYLFNKFERGDFNQYLILKDALKMREIAESSNLSEGKKKAYQALELFMQAYVFYDVTMQMGDIPCSEAVKGETAALYTPKYDTQEQVFETIIGLLGKAAALFGEAEYFDGDPIYGGDVSLWQRASNSLALRVLNMASKKENIGAINVQQSFEEFAVQPIFRSEADNFQRVYSESKSKQWYPFYWERHMYYNFPYLSSYMVDMLKGLSDYRLFYYGEPAAELAGTHPADSFDAYSGVDATMQYGNIQNECSQGKHSAINRRYHQVKSGEPVKFIAYSEIQFILAEAALRGWHTPLSAKAHYEEGVRAAMTFTAENTPSEYRHGVIIDPAYIDEYLQGEAAFDKTKGVEQIMQQKYLAALFQLSFNSYYDYRRTGYPSIPINPETNLNEIKNQMPQRWMYPENEYSQNKVNIEEAINRQFGGEDTPNGQMWILK